MNVALAAAPDGYLYVWGTYGGGERLVHGASTCAVGTRVRTTQLRAARAHPALTHRRRLGRPSRCDRVYDASNRAQPWQKSESAATPLFRDATPCGAELGVEWIPALARWVMLYGYATANPSGIVMRTAPKPWGPWSAAQTVFNPARDRGYCALFTSTIRPADACRTPVSPGRPARRTRRISCRAGRPRRRIRAARAPSSTTRSRRSTHTGKRPGQHAHDGRAGRFAHPAAVQGFAAGQPLQVARYAPPQSCSPFIPAYDARWR